MVYYEVDELTINGNHQKELDELYEKWNLQRSAKKAKNKRNKRRKNNKNIKFKDMDENKESDPYLDDMKSQFANYSMDDIDGNNVDEDEECRQYLIGEIIET